MVGLYYIDMPFVGLKIKTKTARNPNLKIITDKRHKLMAGRKPAFASAYIPPTEVISLDSFDKNLLRELGYGSMEHYLSEPFNKGLKMSDTKQILTFEDLEVNWDIYTQISAIMDWKPVAERYHRILGGY